MVKGNLPVTYNGNTQDYWITNGLNIGGMSALETDTMPLKFKIKSGYLMISTKALDPRTSDRYNWVNCAVHYDNNIEITNIGKNTRKVQYIVGSPDSWGKTVVTYSPNNSAAYKLQSWRLQRAADENVVVSVNVEAGKTVTIPVEVTLGGMSSGYIKQYVRIQ